MEVGGCARAQLQRAAPPYRNGAIHTISIENPYVHVMLSKIVQAQKQLLIIYALYQALDLPLQTHEAILLAERATSTIPTTEQATATIPTT